jgi:hypothetical protein
MKFLEFGKARAVKEFEADNPGLLDKAKAAGDENAKISILKDAIEIQIRL